MAQTKCYLGLSPGVGTPFPLQIQNVGHCHPWRLCFEDNIIETCRIFDSKMPAVGSCQTNLWPIRAAVLEAYSIVLLSAQPPYLILYKIESLCPYKIGKMGGIFYKKKWGILIRWWKTAQNIACTFYSINKSPFYFIKLEIVIGNILD